MKPGEPGQLFAAAALKEVPSCLPTCVARVVGQLLIIVVRSAEGAIARSLHLPLGCLGMRVRVGGVADMAQIKSYLLAALHGELV